MRFTRRELLKLGLTTSFLGSARVSLGDMGPSGNLYLVFNSVPEAESGESDEFTTPRNLSRVLGGLGVPLGSTVVAIGARSGTPLDPYGAPGEMAIHWRYGDPWNGTVTSTKDASPVPLGLDDPVPFMMVGALDEKTAHRFVYSDPAIAGAVLWNFNRDDTTKPIVNMGFHNAYSKNDGGLAETIYAVAQSARANPYGWATSSARGRLQRFFPGLADPRSWGNLAATYHDGLVERHWLPYVRSQGWGGAAVVLQGSFRNVVGMHQLAWHHRVPGEGSFELFKTFSLTNPLGFRLRSEYRSFAETPDLEWTMVGYLFDPKAPGAATFMEHSDIFGHPFHLHGFRADGARLAHVLMACAGSGPIKLALYPLSFTPGKGAFLFDNDLTLDPATLAQSSSGLTIAVHNQGENFARNLTVRLRDSFGAREEKVVLPLVGPRSKTPVTFTGTLGRDAKASSRSIKVDANKHFLQGGAGTRNDTVTIDANLGWRFS